MWRRGKENSAHPTHVISKGRLCIWISKPPHWPSSTHNVNLVSIFITEGESSSITFPSSCFHDFPKVSQNEIFKENSKAKGKGNGLTEENATVSVRVRRIQPSCLRESFGKTKQNKKSNSKNRNPPLPTNHGTPLPNWPSSGLEEAEPFLQGVPASISKLPHCPLSRVPSPILLKMYWGTWVQENMGYRAECPERSPCSQPSDSGDITQHWHSGT